MEPPDNLLVEHDDLAMREAAARLALVSRPDEVAAEIGRLVTRTVGTDSVAIALPVSSTEAELLLMNGLAAGASEEARRLPLTAHHPLIDTLRDGKPRMIGDIDSLLMQYPELERRARAGGDQSWAHVALEHEGKVVGSIALGFSVPRRFTERDEKLFEEFAHVCLAAIERARLYDAEASARRLAESVAARSSALVAAAIAANQATTPREVLVAVADSVQRILGGVVPLASFWREGDAEPAEVLSTDNYPQPTIEQIRFVRARLRQSRATVVVHGTETAGLPGNWRDARTLVLIPILTSGRRIGALSVLLDRDVAEDELALLAALASLASQAFERSRLHEREHQVAMTLQQSLLTFDFPPIEGIDCTARYRSSADQLDVGGDWFQLVPLSGPAVGVAVGDVVGRGLEAASAMGQLRSALAGVAMSRPSPVHVLRTLDTVATIVPGGLYTTVAYGLLDPGKRSLRYACAGHPPPVVIRNGEGRVLDHGRGAPLAADQQRDGEGRLELLPGDQLLFYSDGLIERRAESIDESLRRLLQHASAVSHLGIEAASDELLSRMLDPRESADDDVTLLWLAVL